MAIPSQAVRYSMDIGQGPESGSIFTPRIGRERLPVAPGIGTGSPVSPITRPIAAVGANPQTPQYPVQRGPMLPSRRSV